MCHIVQLKKLVPVGALVSECVVLASGGTGGAVQMFHALVHRDLRGVAEVSVFPVYD